MTEFSSTGSDIQTFYLFFGAHSWTTWKLGLNTKACEKHTIVAEGLGNSNIGIAVWAENLGSYLKSVTDSY